MEEAKSLQVFFFSVCVKYLNFPVHRLHLYWVYWHWDTFLVFLLTTVFIQWRNLEGHVGLPLQLLLYNCSLWKIEISNQGLPFTWCTCLIYFSVCWYNCLWRLDLIPRLYNIFAETVGFYLILWIRQVLELVCKAPHADGMGLNQRSATAVGAN